MDEFLGGSFSVADARRFQPMPRRYIRGIHWDSSRISGRCTVFFSFFTASTFFHKRSYHKINNMHTKKKYHGFAGLKVSARQTFFCLFPGIVTYRSKKIEVFGFVLSTFLRFWFCFVYFFDEMHEYKSTRKITIERYYRFLNRTCTASFSLFSCVCMNTMGKQIAYNYQCIQHFAEQFIKCNI